MLAAFKDPAFYANPYPLYAELRRKDPVLFVDMRGGSWLFTSHADVAAALKLPQLSSARAGHFLAGLSPAVRAEFEPLAETLSRWLLYYDPPRHTRIRKLMAKAFTQYSVDSLRARIERVTHELLDMVQPTGRMDVIKDLACELPLYRRAAGAARGSGGVHDAPRTNAELAAGGGTARIPDESEAARADVAADHVLRSCEMDRAIGHVRD